MGTADNLLALQEVDLALLRARKRLDTLPIKGSILELRKKMNDIVTLRGKAEEHRAGVAREVARFRDEAEAISTKIDEEQAKLMSGTVSNPRELTAITREMDSLRRQKEKAEFLGLEQMERLEKADEQIAKVDAALAQGKEREAQLIERFREEGGGISAEVESLEARRVELVAAISDPTLIERYDALRLEKHGIGAGALEDSACTACRVSLPAGDVAKLREAGPIGTCPSCHRILVIRS